MSAKTIDINTKWNEYPSHTLYLWDGNTLFRITEGSGVNLFPEDEAVGYKDYWMTDFYNKETGDGGQWMETELIRNLDYTIQGVLDRLKECDLWDSDWKIIDETIGEQLIDAFEQWWAAQRTMNSALLKVQNA